MAALNADIPAALKKTFAKACLDAEVNLKDAVAEALVRWLEARDVHQIPVAGRQSAQSDPGVKPLPIAKEGFTDPYFRSILDALQSLLEAGKIKEIQALATLAGALAEGVHDDQEGSHEKAEPIDKSETEVVLAEAEGRRKTALGVIANARRHRKTGGGDQSPGSGDPGGKG